jgi:RNA polymerase sigma factor (sigma-70 family)
VQLLAVSGVLTGVVASLTLELIEPGLAGRLAQDLDQVFAEVVAAYEAAVYTTALRLCDRVPDAEDLTAETFLRAYAGLRGYPPSRIAELQLRPWLLTICLNQWRNQLRTSARRPRVVAAAGVGAAGAVEQPSPAESPEARLERVAEGDRLAAALRALPTKQRVAVVLRHIVGLSYSETAAVLACPEGTAKSHVSRGLDRLRTLLDNDSLLNDVTEDEVLP